MPVTLAFDVYGTLIDTHDVIKKLQGMVGNPHEFSRTWREKQLEYSFRRGLMQNYESFAICTRDALNYACSFYKASLATQQKEQLLQMYRSLPAFDDVHQGVGRVRSAGFRTYAFSNGTAEAVETILKAAGIRDLFVGVVSVDDLRTFKPSPAVYSLFLRKTASLQSSAWLISANPFDVIGAISAGMKGVWLKRSDEAIFDPWGIEPTLVVNSLLEVGDRIARHESEVTVPAVSRLVKGLLDVDS